MSKKNLIIFTHGGGRFANQLISYAHLIAFIIEQDYKYDLINMAFWPYADLLKNTSKNIACTFPTTHNQWKILQNIGRLLQVLSTKNHYRHRLHNKVIRMLYYYSFLNSETQSIIAKDASGLKIIPANERNIFDLNNSTDFDLFNQSKVTLLAGWEVRSWQLVKKYQTAIRNGLSLNPKYTEVATSFIQKLREKNDFLIGVLIRQTDFKEYCNGKYYFKTEQYIDWIKQAQDLFGADFRIGFIVASDEQQDLVKFKHLNVTFATGTKPGKGHYLEDMAELSQCDLIMTPPSTFGVWAAFLGAIPVLPLCEPSQKIVKEGIFNTIFDLTSHPDMRAIVH